MGESETLHLARRPDPEPPELRIDDLAQELLLPLQAVRLGMGLVRRQTPRAPEVIKKIDATLQAMERTVGELLDVSRPHSEGRLLAEPRIGLAGICRSVITDVSVGYPERTIVLNADDEACGSWDGERVRELVRKLLANALRHGAKDAPVELSVIDLGERALLAVVHRGEPIPADLREHLFDPFQPGVGEGLYLVKRTVEALGGSVEVDSDEAWTAFRVTLPAAERGGG